MRARGVRAVMVAVFGPVSIVLDAESPLVGLAEVARPYLGFVIVVDGSNPSTAWAVTLSWVADQPNWAWGAADVRPLLL
jgi:hypothetical protein